MNQPRNVYGDPWNEPVSAAGMLRTVIALGVFIMLVVLFAIAASTWIGNLPSDRTSSAAAPVYAAASLDERTISA